MPLRRGVYVSHASIAGHIAGTIMNEKKLLLDDKSPDPEIKDEGEGDAEEEAFEREERRLKLKNLRVDLIVKPLAFFTAVIALAVAYTTIKSYIQQNQKLEDERFIVEEKIEFGQTQLSRKSSLLQVYVDLINRGGETIKPYAHAAVKEPCYKNEGLYLIVYEISTQPNRLIDSEEGDAVYGPYNMLKKYSNSARIWYESYRIKPHTTYHESEAIILERNKLYQVLVRFFALSSSNGCSTITESRYVYVN